MSRAALRGRIEVVSRPPRDRRSFNAGRVEYEYSHCLPDWETCVLEKTARVLASLRREGVHRMVESLNIVHISRVCDIEVLLGYWTGHSGSG